MALPPLHPLHMICSLPNVLTLFTSNIPKEHMKTLVKKMVLQFLEKQLFEDVSGLDTLEYFQPAFYSLAKPHPIFTSAGPSPYEVEKSNVQARMLSGRYRTERLRRHWIQN